MNIYVVRCLENLYFFDLLKSIFANYLEGHFLFVENDLQSREEWSSVFDEIKNRSVKNIHLFFIKNIESEDDFQKLLKIQDNIRKTWEDASLIYPLYLHSFCRIKEDLFQHVPLNEKGFFIFLDRKRDGSFYSIYEWFWDVFYYFYLLSLNEKESHQIQMDDLLPFLNNLTFSLQIIYPPDFQEIKKSILESLQSYLEARLSREEKEFQLSSFEDLKNELQKSFEEAFSFDSFKARSRFLDFLSTFRISRKSPTAAKDSIYALVDFLEENFQDIENIKKEIQQYFHDECEILKDVYARFLKQKKSVLNLEKIVKEAFRNDISLPEISKALQNQSNSVGLLESATTSLFSKFASFCETSIPLSSVKDNVNFYLSEFLKIKKSFDVRSFFISFFVFLSFSLLIVFLKFIDFQSYYDFLIILAPLILSLFTYFYLKQKNINKAKEKFFEEIEICLNKLVEDANNYIKVLFKDFFLFSIRPFLLNLGERHSTSLVLAKTFLKDAKIYLENVKLLVDNILSSLRDIRSRKVESNFDWSFIFDFNDEILKNSLLFEQILLIKIKTSLSENINLSFVYDFNEDDFKNKLPLFPEEFFLYGSPIVIKAPVIEFRSPRYHYRSLDENSEISCIVFYLTKIDGKRYKC